MAPVLQLEPLRNAVFVLGGAVLLLTLLLVIQRVAGALSSAREERREALLTRLVYRGMQGGNENSPDKDMLSRLNRRRVRGILLRLALDLRGESGDAIAGLYGHLGFLKADLKRLRSPWASVRANAVADLGLVRADAALPALLERLDDQDDRVRQTAVWAVGQVAGQETLSALVRLLGDPDRIVARRAQEVLAERGREAKDAILVYARKTSTRPGRVAAIELIGWLRIVEGVDLLLEFMHDLDFEVRVKSVKAAAAIGDPRFIPVLNQRLTDSRWEVRCQAAKGLSLFGSPDSVSRLEAAMRDEHWWVRFYAATALAEAGPTGADALLTAMLDPRPDVRTMARYLLERGEVVPALP
jgi:HEAT repeat protein